MLDEINYDAWGSKTSESAPSAGSRYDYAGKEWDGNLGLQYNVIRYYNPVTGTWTTQDPDGFDAGDSNLNRYVQNGPTNAIDPSGRDLFFLTRDYAKTNYFSTKNQYWWKQGVPNHFVYLGRVNTLFGTEHVYLVQWNLETTREKVDALEEKFRKAGNTLGVENVEAFKSATIHRSYRFLVNGSYSANIAAGSSQARQSFQPPDRTVATATADRLA